MKRYLSLTMLAAACVVFGCESTPNSDSNVCMCATGETVCTCANCTCAAAASAPTAASQPASSAEPQEFDEVRQVDLAVPNPAQMTRSNSGSFLVDYKVAEAEEIPTNEQFQLLVRVFDAETLAPIHDGLSLSVDAAMPHHGHGMIREPSVQPAGDGSFVVTGMLFHMVGRWELYFDVTRDGVTDRAQCVVFLE